MHSSIRILRNMGEMCKLTINQVFSFRVTQLKRHQNSAQKMEGEMSKLKLANTNLLNLIIYSFHSISSNYKNSLRKFIFLFILLGLLDILSALVLTDILLQIGSSTRVSYLQRVLHFFEKKYYFDLQSYFAIVFILTILTIFLKIVLTVIVQKRFYLFLAEISSNGLAKLISNLGEAKYLWFKSLPENDLLFIITYGCQYLYVGILGSVVLLLVDAFIAFIFIFFLAMTNLFFLTTILISFGLLSLMYSKIILKKIELNGELQVQNQLLTQQSWVDLTRSWREVLTMNKFGLFAKEVSDANLESSRAFARNNLYQSFPKHYIELSLLLFLIVGSIFSFFLESNQIASTLLIFSAVSLRLFPIIARIQQGIFGMKSFQNTAIRVWELNQNIVPASLYEKERRTKNSNLKESITGDSISIRNLRFGFEEVVDSLIAIDSVYIDSGSFVILSGPSGSGKSTFLEILAGLIEPQSGEILFNIEHSNEISNENTRPSRISFMSQNPSFLNSSIFENLLFKNVKHDLSSDEAMQILTQLKLEDKINSLNEGIFSHIAGNQFEWSGGERQRLALARSLAQKPTLLLIDEGTSALDSENEVLVLNYLKTLSPKCTILMVSHNAIAEEYADFILRFENGHVLKKSARN